MASAGETPSPSVARSVIAMRGPVALPAALAGRGRAGVVGFVVVVVGAACAAAPPTAVATSTSNGSIKRRGGDGAGRSAGEVAGNNRPAKRISLRTCAGDHCRTNLAIRVGAGRSKCDVGA